MPRSNLCFSTVLFGILCAFLAVAPVCAGTADRKGLSLTIVYDNNPGIAHITKNWKRDGVFPVS